MAQIETWFEQDLKKPVKVTFLDGNVFSADNDGNKVGVKVYSDGEPVTLTGTISGNVIRPDGTTVAVTGASEGNSAWIVLPQAAYTYPGVVSIIIKNTVNSTVSTICAVVATVYESTTSVVVDPGTIIPSIETLITSIETAVASIPADYSALWTSLAPAFDSTKSYVAGQYVTYNGGVYRFITTHTGSWVAADAVAINIGGELSDLKSAIHDGTNIEDIALNLLWEQGAISSSGADVNGNYLTYWIRTSFYPADEIATILGSCLTGLGKPLAIYCAQYTAAKTFIKYQLRNIAEGGSAGSLWVMEDDCAYVRFCAAKYPTSSKFSFDAGTESQYVGLTATSKLSLQITELLAEKDEDGVRYQIDGLKDTNSFNLLNNAPVSNKSSASVEWEVNDNGSIYVHGTASSTSLFNFCSGAIVDWIKPGRKYYVQFNSDNIDFRVLVANSLEAETTNILNTRENAEFIVPTGTVKLIIRLAVSSGTVVSETVHPILFEIPTNAMLADIPKSYYISEIRQTIEDVYSANTEPGLVFLTCTDPHYLSMIGTYPTTLVKEDSVTDMCVNMKNVADAIKADAVVCLGDIVDSAASSSTYTTEQTTEQIKTVMQRFHKIGLPLIYAIGNHDDNRYVSGECFTSQQLYSMFMSYCPSDRVSDGTFNGLNYSLDYAAYKIRVLVVDEAYMNNDNWHYGYANETITWFSNELSNIPSGWGVLVFTHRGFVKDNNVGKALHTGQQAMIDAVQAFVNGGGNYIATIYGHSHVDYSNTTPWLEISIGSAKAHNITPDDTFPTGSVNPLRTRGTATEDLWDVVIVQPGSRKIKTIRFGAGSNRTFSY